MVRSLQMGRWRKVVAFAILLCLIVTTGCALTAKGTIQTVPVASTLADAEVFIDGDFVGRPWSVQPPSSWTPPPGRGMNSHRREVDVAFE